ncbi:hypothetical protein BD414DRAFT_415750 [Trametes punicea]|nr:hypothetical protein BD414DRAFT_415750 [Trametes punicea]
MEYFQARLDSFLPLKSKRLKASSSKQASTSRWPHPPTWKATPSSLAEAGFYYTPGPQDPDNVTCFMCKKDLCNWEPEDDPFEIHYAKCGDKCAWATLRCQKPREDGSYDLSDPTRHPTSKAMEKARLDTFAVTEWPHDAVKGHGANSRALARAGFVWSASEPGDDTAICLYCNLSLSGWDMDDDPYQEHLKRDKRNQTSCAFLQAYAETSLSKSTSNRPSSRVASKGSRSASQTIKDTAAEASDDSEDELAAAPSSETAASRLSNARKSKARSSRASTAPAKTPASRRSARGTSTGGRTPGSKITVSSEVEETDVGSESETSKRSSRSKRKTGGRSKARVSAIAEEEDEEFGATRPDENVEMQEPEEAQEQEQPKEKRKRGRPPKNAAASKTAPPSQTKVAKTQVREEIAHTGVEAGPAPAAVKKTHARTRSKATLESEADAAVASSSRSTHTRTKSSSRTKLKQEEVDSAVSAAPTGKRKGKQKATAAPMDDEEDIPPAPPKAKIKGPAVPRPKKQPEQTQLETEDPLPLHDHRESNRQSHRVGRSPSPQVPKVPPRRTPSLSDDAGYATAEPQLDADRMEVDENMPIGQPAQVEDSRLTAVSDANAVPQRSRPRSAVHRSDDDEIERPSPALNGVANGRSATSSRASSARPFANIPNQKIVNDTLKVIEIDSDGEEIAFSDAPSKARPAERTTPASGSSKPASKRAVTNLQVDVVLPSKRAHPPPRDVPIQDSPTGPIRSLPVRSPSPVVAMAKSGPPSTPVSAVHISSQVSLPRHEPLELDNANRDVAMPTQTIGLAASPRAYHPILAQVPIEKLTNLTEEEADMTLEQYIRREMELQYAQFKADAERRIDEFKERAAEARRLIEKS